ncbi:hypothetical protein ABEB36_007699 [Hypothenemus hampei]|uniref:Peptidase C1A papain C-terminal domain-containing protein n=1 Tax=Hypothenemus hampei TaxID=57062 RepID=A0ABD1EUV3_HYPHA
MIVILLLAVVQLGWAVPSKQLHPLSAEYIDEINSKQSLWKAEKYFDDYELFRTIATGAKKYDGKKILVVHNATEDVPESFDSAENWSECADIISLIRDQSRCGACWAFAAVEAMSDRICIHSNGTRKLLVSSQDLLTCAAVGGCNGGWPYLAWYAWKFGIVTGGLYNTTEQGCKSYFLEPCNDHPNKCTNYVKTPACVDSCDISSQSYKQSETYGKTPYEVVGEKQIQLEILKNGPVEATMDVYEDFASYKSGIYKQITGKYEGGHAVKIVGWGVENDVKYWKIANSWNENWGENGYFRILRGVDEVGIESDITGALPNFSKF